jgi:hypothetical protein
MIARITKYDEELVELSKRFLEAAQANPESCAFLERYGYSREEHERGLRLVRDARRSFDWERRGMAWNFLSTTPERRAAEARAWYADRRRRHMRACVRRGEEAAGWTGNRAASRRPLWRKLTVGTLAALREAAGIASARAWLGHRAELRRDLARASGPKPTGAPPPKDTALVELAGWYERWRLLAHRVFRERPDLLAPYGLEPGKAPPRLRGKGAASYGEGAAGSLGGARKHLEVLEDAEDAAEA